MTDDICKSAWSRHYGTRDNNSKLVGDSWPCHFFVEPLFSIRFYVPFTLAISNCANFNSWQTINMIFVKWQERKGILIERLYWIGMWMKLFFFFWNISYRILIGFAVGLISEIKANSKTRCTHMVTTMVYLLSYKRFELALDKTRRR